MQAVTNERLGISEIVFYVPGRLALANGLEVSVDRPCMVMLNEMEHPAKLTVSSPEGPLQVHVTVSDSTARQRSVKFDLLGSGNERNQPDEDVGVSSIYRWRGFRLRNGSMSRIEERNLLRTASVGRPSPPQTGY
jgi:hypothetical protein